MSLENEDAARILLLLCNYSLQLYNYRRECHYTSPLMYHEEI